MNRRESPTKRHTAFVRFAATIIAVTFLVVPSLLRLAFLLDVPHPADPTDRAFAEHRWTGFLHVVPGLLMVVLMPIQMSTRLRRRRPALHRWSGRMFVLSGLSVSITAAVMNLLFPVVGASLKVSVIYTMCVAQVVTLMLGLRAALKRDVPQHRRWMMRAMGVALSAGSAGLFAVPLYAMGMLDALVGVGRWLGFVGTLVVVEWWLRAGESASAAPASTR
jgi:hypothetical protein